MISSLQAIRKLTKAIESPATPIEGFQKYLEGSGSQAKDSPTVSAFKKGISLGLIRNFWNKTLMRQKTRFFKVWRFATIKNQVYADQQFIDNEIKNVLRKAIMNLKLVVSKTLSSRFGQWKNLTPHRSPVTLAFVLAKVYENRVKSALVKISFVQREKTKLVYHVISNLLKILSKKFERWKINSSSRTTEAMIANKLALLNFKEFQKFKLLEIITVYRKVREIYLKKFFFRWGVYRPKVKAAGLEKRIEKAEGKLVEKLKKQKSEHENAVIEANIKENLLNMLINILNTN